jgi:hypothetical protein
MKLVLSTSAFEVVQALPCAADGLADVWAELVSEMAANDICQVSSVRSD